jgi:hypothetical protein
MEIRAGLIDAKRFTVDHSVESQPFGRISDAEHSRLDRPELGFTPSGLIIRSLPLRSTALTLFDAEKLRKRGYKECGYTN